MGSFLNEDDARFLIDQYNKYVSYALKPSDWTISEYAFAIAVLAVALSVFSQATHIEAGGSALLNWWLGAFELVFFLGILCYLLYRLHWLSKKISGFQHEQLNHTLRLGYLIEHFLTYKSLPDSITFAYLQSTKPDDLRKLLLHSGVST